MGGQRPIFYLLFSLRKPSFNLFYHRLELRKRLGEVGRNKHCVLHSLGPHFGFNCLVVAVPWQHAIRGSGLGFPRWKLTSVEIEPLGQNILFGAIKSVLTFSWPLSRLIISALKQVVLNFLIRFLDLLAKNFLDFQLTLLWSSLEGVLDRGKCSHLPMFGPSNWERPAVGVLVCW